MKLYLDTQEKRDDTVGTSERASAHQFSYGLCRSARALRQRNQKAGAIYGARPFCYQGVACTSSHQPIR